MNRVVLSFIEFDGLEFTCSDEQRRLTSSGNCPIATGTDALRQVGMDDVQVSHDFGYLLALTGIFLVIAFLFLKFELTRA
jgi:hypothetical protein